MYVYVCIHTKTGITQFSFLTFGDLCELLAHSLHPRVLQLEGAFVLWVRERLHEIKCSGHSDLQVCAPTSLSLSAVLETWLV